MSYILDALRKADAERERDPARGIHAQPLAPLPGRPRRSPAVLWAGCAGAAVAAVLATAAVWRDAPVEARPAPAALPMPGAAPVVAVPGVMPVAAASVVQPAPPLVIKAPVAPRTPAAEASAPAARTAAAETPAPTDTPAEAAAPAGKGAAADVAAPNPRAVAGPPAGPAASRILALAELPAELQRELPRLAISGGVHSQHAAQRMLIVGGQVMSEGAELAPGLFLEQIRARTAVLRFKGYRYSVAY